MASIVIKNLNISYDIYDLISRSLKGKLISQIKKISSLSNIGGEISSSNQGIFVNALKDINLTINDGDRVGIVGHNGSGKSTLLKALSGIIYPVSGEIIIDGNVGSVLDAAVGVDYELTGIENIYVRGVTLGMEKKFIDDNLNEIKEFCDLGDFIYLPVKTYSNGMKARLAFSITAILKPEIYLIDEALEAGDLKFQEKIRDKFDQNLTNIRILVLASHNNSFIQKYCNKILELEKGVVKKFYNI